MVCLLSGDDRGEGSEREVDTGEAKWSSMKLLWASRELHYIRNKVRLELVEIDVEGTVEPKGRRDRGDDLRNKAVEVREAGGRNVEALLADVVNGLVVNHERAV